MDTTLTSFLITKTLIVLDQENKITEIKKITGDDQANIGFIISTSKKMNGHYLIVEHSFLIDNRQKCCEEWGYLCTDDNVDEYIGSELIKIDETYRGGLNGNQREMIEDKDVVFTTIYTSTGSFQLKAYTIHNGFYGHEVKYSVQQKMVRKE